MLTLKKHFLTCKQAEVFSWGSDDERNILNATYL